MRLARADGRRIRRSRRLRRAAGVQREGPPPGRGRPRPDGARGVGVLVRDHRGRRRLQRRLRRGTPRHRGHPADPVRPDRGERGRPQGRDRRRARAGRRLDRRRHDVPEQRDPAPGQGARGLGPGRGGPNPAAGHRQGGARSPAKWLDPPAGQLPRRDPDPGSQLGHARVPGERRAPVPASAPVGLLARHDDHDGVPRQRLLGEVHADRVRAVRASPEVPLLERHEALPHPGGAHGPLLQPAARVPPAGDHVRARSASAR